MSLSSRDQQLIWHPFTQHQTANLPLAIMRAEGSYLYDDQGQAYLDLISSWWVNLHGHCHPAIVAAIHQQAQTLEHVLFADCTHSPAVILCENLKSHLPEELTRFFFSDNGSTTVEVALKMAYQYWCHQGESKRHRYLSFEGGYHGDTYGAMSVGRQSGFHQAFDSFFFDVHCFPYPETWTHDEEIEVKEALCLDHISTYLQTYGEESIALIVEPLVQGASGMRMCRPKFLQQVIDLARSYHILIIFDEVMTGFGRTGSLFALSQVERTPDMLCLSKGLTGGFLPLALTCVTEDIYQAFLNPHIQKAFAHGHSYTANPLGCAASIASFKLLNTSYTSQQIEMITQEHLKGLQMLSQRHSITLNKMRALGTIAAFDIKNSTDDQARLKKIFLDAGLLIRPLGNTVYLLPPYCIKKEELQEAYEKINQLL